MSEPDVDRVLRKLHEAMVADLTERLDIEAGLAEIVGVQPRTKRRSTSWSGDQ